VSQSRDLCSRLSSRQPSCASALNVRLPHATLCCSRKRVDAHNRSRRDAVDGASMGEPVRGRAGRVAIAPTLPPRFDTSPARRPSRGRGRAGHGPRYGRFARVSPRARVRCWADRRESRQASKEGEPAPVRCVARASLRDGSTWRRRDAELSWRAPPQPFWPRHSLRRSSPRPPPRCPTLGSTAAR
jgi:hypothetical protein